MSDPYRIVKHQDSNGVTFYTIQVQHRWIFGLKFWSTLKSYSSDGSCSRSKMFDTLEEAQKFIRGTTWTHSVVEEGVL